MTVLIVEPNAALAAIWGAHLQRCGWSVELAANQREAIGFLREDGVSLVVLDLDLGEDSAFAVADYAAYRHPDLKIVFVTARSFFSDGSIFNHAANACAYVGVETPPEDLAAMVEHYAAAS